MIKVIIVGLLLAITLTGCVSKMIGGAVDVVTFGIVKNDINTKPTTSNQATDNVQG